MSATNVAGTMGLPNLQSVVYSFGVLALEIVAGNNNMKLQEVVGLKQKGCLIDLVDLRLGSILTKKEVMRIMEIALSCINQSSALWPSMSEVVYMVEVRTIIQEPNSKSDDKVTFQLSSNHREVMHSFPGL